MRDKLISIATYAAKRELLVLYGVLFVGLSLLNWNIFLPLFGLFGGFGSTIAVALRGIFAFLTAILGFVLTVVAFVGIIKVVVDDAVGGHRLGDMVAERNTETAAVAAESTAAETADETDESDDDAETGPAIDATEDGQAAE